MSEILSVTSKKEFEYHIREVGKQVIGLFYKLPLPEIQNYTERLLTKDTSNKDFRVKKDDIAPIVNDLAIIVAEVNGFKRRSNQLMVGGARIFGARQRHSGAHIDANINTSGTQMPVLGTWLQFTGSSRVSLAQIPSFDSQDVHDTVESLRIDTDDPDYELGVMIRPEMDHKFSKFDAIGPYVGVWAIGMSQERNIFTTLHQVETTSDEPRISTTLIQNYTDRIY